MLVTAATRSGDHSAATARIRSSPSRCGARSPSLTRSSANSVWATASSSAASVPGVIGSHSSARAAVAVRTGSITITLPRLRIRVDDPHHVGRGQQRPLRRGRVGAHHDQQVGALDVGHREGPPAAVHQVRRKVLRPLVDRAGRVAERDAGHAEQHAGVAAKGEGVRQRVAGVAGHRADAVLLDDGSEQFGAAAEGRVPADFPPLPVDLDHRAPDAVGVLVQGAERRALRADVPSTPGVVAVAADAGDPSALDLDLQSAHGFTQRTGIEVSAVLADTRHRLGRSRRHQRLPDLQPPRPSAAK